MNKQDRMRGIIRKGKKRIIKINDKIMSNNLIGSSTALKLLFIIMFYYLLKHCTSDK